VRKSTISLADQDTSATQILINDATEAETEEIMLPRAGISPLPPGWPTDVGPIDIDAYMGRWYEMYTSLISLSTWEKNEYCVTADYTLLPRDKMDKDKITFQVVNFMRKGGPKGELQKASGEATNKRVKIQTPVDGVWYLKYDEPKIKGLFVIQAVRPIVDGLYAWTMISDALRNSIFILARDVKTFDKLYGAKVIKIAKDKGFTKPWSKPIKSEQPSSCKYAELPQ
jgi:lipocalin